jgi:hypothetical protein
MTEAEWLESTDPFRMLNSLNGRTSDRKFRHFACACCRRLWDSLPDRRAQNALEIAERFADGLVDDKQRSEARKAAQQSAQTRAVIAAPVSPKHHRRAASAVYYAAGRSGWEAALNVRELVVESLAFRTGDYPNRIQSIRETERLWQVRAIREVIGNPFRAIPVEPYWWIWNAEMIP